MPKEIDGITYYTGDEVYMDQSQVDKVIQDRLARVEKKPEDYDDLKNEAETLRTNLTQAQADLAERDKTLGEKDQEIATAIEEAKQEQRTELLPEIAKARIKAAAIKRGFRNSDDALTFYGDIPEDATDDVISERLSEIASERSYLLTSDPDPSASDVGVGVTGAASASAQPGMARIESVLEPK